jgi:hypothetical protein
MCLGCWYSTLRGFGQAVGLGSTRSAGRPREEEPLTAVGSVNLDRSMIADESPSTDQTLAFAKVTHHEEIPNHLSAKVSTHICTTINRDSPGRAPGSGGKLRGGLW